MNGKPLRLFLFQGKDLLVVNAVLRNGVWNTNILEKIENYNTLAPAELSAKIHGRNSSNKNESKQARHTILVLARTDLALLNMCFPKGEADETAAMLELELDRQLPLDLSKVCFGFETYCAETQDLAQVYWSPLDRIEPYLATLKSAGIEVDEIRPTLPYYHRLPVETPPIQTRSQIFMHHAQIEMIHWSRPGIVGFSRIVDHRLSEHNLSDAELARSLAALIANLNSDSSILLYSAESAKEPISTILAAAGLHVVQANVKFDCAPELTNEAATEFFPLLAVIAGTQTEPAPLTTNTAIRTLNMLPRSIDAQRHRYRLRKTTIRVAMLSALVILLGIANVVLYINRLQTQIDANMAEIKLMTPEARQVEAMEERIASIQRQINYVMTPIDALGTINQILAEQASRLDGLYLDHFDYTEAGIILLEGHSTNDITPWSFAEALDKSGRFKIAQKPRIQMRLYGETRAIRFQMSCQAVESASSKDNKPQ